MELQERHMKKLQNMTKEEHIQLLEAMEEKRKFAAEIGNCNRVEYLEKLGKATRKYLGMQ